MFRPLASRPSRHQPIRTSRLSRRRAAMALERLEDRSLLSSFTVTTALDNGLNNSPLPGSLRKAIIDANNALGKDTIDFQIGNGGLVSILPMSALPAITDTVEIRGDSQGGWKPNSLGAGDNAVINIVLDGVVAGKNVDGLVIDNTPDCLITGLDIVDFGRHGVTIQGAKSTGNHVEGNFIGVDNTGTVGMANVQAGVMVRDSASSNTIGGPALAQRNVISCNGSPNVCLVDAGTANNTVSNNYLGPDATGLKKIGGGLDGVYIERASHNTIGGSSAFGGNLISGNLNAGVRIVLGATDNTISNNLVGTDWTGSKALPNGHAGVDIVDSPGNHVGLPGASGRNVISGNTTNGVEISGSKSTGNRVENNEIGTNAIGSLSLANLNDGVHIEDSSNNTLSKNVISGNNGNGVTILAKAAAASGNQLRANWIGTNMIGMAALGNGIDGVAIQDASGNTVGGTTANDRNLISGNTEVGVRVTSSTGATGTDNLIQGNFIGTDATGAKALANKAGVAVNDASRTTIGGTDAGAGNVISGNTVAGVIVGAAVSLMVEDTLIQGNEIGTDATGTSAMPNYFGVVVDSGSRNTTVGGTAPGSRNVISGNTVGVSLIDEINKAMMNNVVAGNYIGTDVTGTLPLGNQYGVVMNGAQLSTIGGTMPEARNIISNNSLVGIYITSTNNNNLEAHDNVVLGNYVGTDVTGTVALGNHIGIGIDTGAHNNTIGGTSPGARNIISASEWYGILIEDGSQKATKDNLVQANYIGTDATGTKALGNEIWGVLLTAQSNTIGGTAPGAGNVISGNKVAGIAIGLGNGKLNRVLGNWIGTDASGTLPLGNDGDGIAIIVGASENQIGNTNQGGGNVIAFNSGAGVSIVEGDKNKVSGNSIYENGGLGIDLGGNGVSPNDAMVFAVQPNIGLDTPVLTSAVSQNGVTTVTGTYEVVQYANVPLVLEFYASPSVDPTGFGEGKTFLGAGTVQLDAQGKGSFTATLFKAVPAGQYITATAIDGVGNTSEFSHAVQVAGPPVPAGITVTPIAGLSTTESGGTATFSVVLNSVPTADVTIVLSSSDPGEGTVQPAFLTFTPANALTPQVVTVTGKDDALSDGDVAYSIITGAASSADPAYNGLDASDVLVTNLDDDVPAPGKVIVTPVSGLSTTEAGGAATFTVVLATTPKADVSIVLSTSDPSEGNVGQVVLTFTPANALIPQVVKVTGADDLAADGDVAYTIITAPAISADPAYNSLDPDDVALTNIDDDQAGILVTANPGSFTTESGGTTTFSVVLTSVPNADVTVTLSSSDPSEGVVSPVVLTFTPLNALVPQVVTVKGVDDAVLDGDTAYAIITGAAASADPNYNGLDPADVALVNLDNEVPAPASILVTAISNLVTTEAGGTATFSVVLGTVPTADVSVALSSSDTTEGTVAPVVLTFTPANALTAQVVTITGVNDALLDGDIAYAIVTAPATSGDPAYNGLNAADVPVTNLDDESASQAKVIVSVISSQTTEAGGQATFAVVLGTVPTADVSIVLASSDASEGTVAPAVLTFTPGNALVPQVVTVTGVNDLLVDGDVAYSIITSAAISADAAYNGLGVNDVALVNLDDDQAGILVTASPGSFTTEAGGTASFSVVLRSVPTADVTIALSSSDASEGTLSPLLLTFTPGDALVPQTVIVKGVDDALLDGDIAYSIVSDTATSADPNYDGLNPADVALLNLDNELPPPAQIVITPTSGLVTTESGGTATFTVALSKVPTADVSIVLSSSDASEGSVSPIVLTFTPANALVPQTVTVKGVDDAALDGDVPYSIVTGPATSADPAFNGLNAPDVSVTNLDNESAAQAKVIVTPVSGLSTTEAGGTATFTVVLGSIPTADVSIVLSSSDPTEGIAAPLVLTFTPANALVPQVVTVKGVDDQSDDGDVAYAILTGPALSADAAYSGLDPADVSLTNIDDDRAGITVSVAADSVTTEAGGTTTITIVLDSKPSADVTLTVSSSDTTEGTVQPMLVTFTPDDALIPHSLIVKGVDDNDVDGDVPYTIVIGPADSADPGYDLLDGADVLVTNVDNDSDGLIEFAASSFEVDEPAGSATVVVSRKGGLAGGMTVDLATQDGTARAGSDYTQVFTTLTFAPGETTKVVMIPISDDLLDEADETLTLVLEHPAAGAALGAMPTATLRLIDDDPEVQVRVDDLDLVEGSGEQPSEVTFTVRLSGPSSKPVQVNYSTGGGTASAGADYLGVSGSLLFQPGETVKTIVVAVVGDYLSELSETFGVLLSDASNATIARALAIGTIADDDHRVAISIDDTRATEGQSAVFLVRMSAPCGAPVTVSFATADVTARGAADYLATGGTLTFQPGETVKAITVPVLRDTLDEPTEHFGLVLANPEGAALGRSRAVGAILDVTPPRVAGVRPLGFANLSGPIRIAFSEALDATRAVRTGNYSLKTAGRDGRFGTADDRVVAISKAVYDRALHTVTLTPRNPSVLGQDLLLTVNGTAPSSLRDLSGNLLDGNADGRPGGNYSVVVKGVTGAAVHSQAVPDARVASRLSAAKLGAKTRVFA